LDQVTPHTLRHSFASMAAAQGFSELTISGLLGHAPRGVTQRYVHLDTALIIAADQVAAEIARLLNGGELRSGREITRSAISGERLARSLSRVESAARVTPSPCAAAVTVSSSGAMISCLMKPPGWAGFFILILVMAFMRAS
jgi:hypothetical protein